MKAAPKPNKKPRPQEIYQSYEAALPEEQRESLAAFFADLDAHCLIAKDQQKALRGDFQNALVYYADAGIPLEEAMQRLSIRNIGGFYARPPILWYPLDDAAKIYPLSMKPGQMAVFRLSIYLDEPVVLPILQMALNFAIKRFPSFATTVKKGFFWHYLDTAKRRFLVQEDTGLPCLPLRVARSGSQSFRVMAYQNRISVEFFHILTDGTGGMTFLKTLAAEYLRLMGHPCAAENGVLNIHDAPTEEELANKFSSADKTDKNEGFVDKPAVQMSGRLARNGPYRILHFKLDAALLKAAAKAHGASVTAYVLALLFIAGQAATDETKGEINIQVPVNMRKFYPSDTVRNFAMYCGIRLPLSAVTTVDELVPLIARQLEEKASKAAMSRMMNATQKMVSAVRYVPLFIKTPIAKVVYGFLGDKIFSNTLSNLGVVDLPKEMAPHVQSMDFVLGTMLTNRAGCAMVTCNCVATLSITKMTADPSFEEKLYELLEQDGIHATVEGSEPHAG